MGETALTLPSAAAPDVWECSDCGEQIVLTDATYLDHAANHWKVCSKPNDLTLQKRRRVGLDPQVLPLSASALLTYEECPRQAYHGFVDPARPRLGGGGPAELGHALHTALETGSDDPPPSLPADLEADWDWMLPRALRMVAEAEERDPRPHVTYTELEVLWDVELDDGRRAQARAFIDRLLVFPDMSFVVIDYKSGRVLPDVDALQQGLQLQMYLVAARRWHPGLGYGRAEQLQIREDKALPLPKSGWMSAERIDNLEKLLVAKIKRFARERTWMPTPGEHCAKHCDFVHRCTAGLEYLGAGVEIVVPKSTLVFTEPDQVANGYAALAVAKAQARLLEDSLKKAVRQNTKEGEDQPALGPVALEDGRLLRWVQKSSPGIRSPENVVEAARRTQEAGADASRHIHWDNRKKAPDGVELADLYEDKVYPEFGAWTPEEIQRHAGEVREARERIKAKERAALAAKEAS